MLAVANRNNARTLGTIINTMAGYKLTKQARSKVGGLWPIPFTKGTLKLPSKVNRSLRLPAQRIKRKIFVVGQDVLTAKEHAKQHSPEPIQPMTAMSEAFQNAQYAH